MNKVFSIVMMLCATTILLAHAVVPHHHHDNTACFISPVEEHEHHCCEHDNDQNEDPVTHDEDEACVLSDFLAIVPHTYKQDNPDVEYAVNNINSNILAYLISPPDENTNIIIPSEAFRQNALPYSSYELWIGKSLGMRAPPSC